MTWTAMTEFNHAESCLEILLRAISYSHSIYRTITRPEYYYIKASGVLDSLSEDWKTGI